MISCATFINVILFLGTLNIITPFESLEIKIPGPGKEDVSTTFDLKELLNSNSTLYTHEDCPLIKKKGLSCPKNIRNNENIIIDRMSGDSKPIRHYCVTLVERDKPLFHFINNDNTLTPFEENNAQKIKNVCSQCVYAINLPTKYLPHLQKYMSDPRCNYTLSQHEYRHKNNKAFKLHTR